LSIIYRLLIFNKLSSKAKQLDWLIDGRDGGNDVQDVINSLRIYNRLPRCHFMAKDPQDSMNVLYCFLQYLMRTINLNRFNIIMWASSPKPKADYYEPRNRPWTLEKYAAVEGPVLKSVREAAQHLDLVGQQVLVLLPNDSQIQVKIEDFFGFFTDMHNDGEHYLAATWFECDEVSDPDILAELFSI
jgi:hypothetical protein